MSFTRGTRGLASRGLQAVALIIVTGATASLNLVSAQGQGKGGGGGHTETVGNNLSYPASFTGTLPVLRGVSGTYTLTGAFGETFSYGCDREQKIGTSTYANTSCIGENGNYLLPAECTVCSGLPLFRMYWQKDTSEWQAGSQGNVGPREVAFVNWGDNLETGQWNERSVVRVETTPFYDFGSANAGATLRGFQMWHVSGQGPSEMWGVRATDTDPAVPFVYDSLYTIIHTTAARLNLTKLAPLPAGGSCGSPPVPPTLNPTPTWSLNSWTGYCSAADLPYTTELNIGGKWVYGYNWQMRNMPLAGCLTDKTGWWRLTFYNPTGSVVFNKPVPTTEPGAPANYYPSPTAAIAPQEEETARYKPVVDPVNKLTYIDICINPGNIRGR